MREIKRMCHSPNLILSTFLSRSEHSMSKFSIFKNPKSTLSNFYIQIPPFSYLQRPLAEDLCDDLEGCCVRVVVEELVDGPLLGARTAHLPGEEMFCSAR